MGLLWRDIFALRAKIGEGPPSNEMENKITDIRRYEMETARRELFK